MKGIILAGGSGTRLYPITKAISKQLLPIYDKPMIYYPLSTLMLSGIRDILIISTPLDLPNYKRLFGSGSHLGLNFSYKEQIQPRGIPEAFIIGEEFIGTSNVCLILGDNLFYGQFASDSFKRAASVKNGAVIFAYHVKDPSPFGVVQIDNSGNVVSIEEKPKEPKSNFAIPGIYFYDNKVIENCRLLEKSARGELEISDLNRIYLQQGSLNVEVFGRGMVWFDTGTHDGLLGASNFVEAIQKRQGLYIACLEEIAFYMNYIDRDQLFELAKQLGKTAYGEYLREIVANVS